MIRAQGQIKHPLEHSLGNELIAKPMTWPSRHESPHRAGCQVKRDKAGWHQACTDVAGGHDVSGVSQGPARQHGGRGSREASTGVHKYTHTELQHMVTAAWQNQ